MGEPSPAKLRTLAAEIRRELGFIERTVGELQWVDGASATEPAGRMRMYAAAAMLDTFYTGIERVLERIARVFEYLPDGPAWHRELLTVSALDVPHARPPVLREETAHALTRYLAFRHRFRNLYLFDLEADQMQPLITGAAPLLGLATGDLQAFATVLEELADVR